MACQLPNAIAIDCRTPDCKSMAKSKNNGKKETDTTAESTWRIRGVAGWTDRQAFVLDFNHLNTQYTYIYFLIILNLTATMKTIFPDVRHRLLSGFTIYLF